MTTTPSRQGHLPINGLQLNHEVYGELGETTSPPLLLIPGAFMATGSMPAWVDGFAGTRTVITFDQQGHGRTPDTARPLSYEQFADDAAALLRALNVERADVMGYSQGGGVALQLALRHPELVGKLVSLSATYRQDGWYPSVMESIGGLDTSAFAGTPVEQAFMKHTPDAGAFAAWVDKMKVLNIEDQQISDEEMRSIAAPTMVIVGDADGVKPEHALAMFELRGGGDEDAAASGVLQKVPSARLVILPATTHIGISGKSATLVPMVTAFLNDVPPTTPELFETGRLRERRPGRTDSTVELDVTVRAGLRARRRCRPLVGTRRFASVAIVGTDPDEADVRRPRPQIIPLSRRVDCRRGRGGRRSPVGFVRPDVQRLERLPARPDPGTAPLPLAPPTRVAPRRRALATMRVAFVTEGDPDRVSGGSLYHRRLVELADANDAAARFVSVPARRYPLAAIDGGRVLREAARDADVVVVDSLASNTLGPWLALGLPRHRVVVGSIHQILGGADVGSVRHRVQQRFDRWSWRRVRHLVVPSPMLAEQLVADGLTDHDITVVAPGRDLPAAGGCDRPELDLRQGRRLALLCVANWLPRKGILAVLDAVAALPDETLTLHLVGDESVDPRYRSRVVARLARADLRDCVVRHGIVPATDIGRYYAAADAFALASTEEPYGMVYAEAMVAGLPVVGWDAGNLPHLVCDGVEGRIVPVGDIAALSAALGGLVDCEARVRMGAAAQRRAASLPTWHETATAFFAVCRTAWDESR